METLLQSLGALMVVIAIWAVVAGLVKVASVLFGGDLDGKTCGAISCVSLAAATILALFLP